MIALPLLLGALTGCLVNYLADVLPYTHRLSWPTCPACTGPITLPDYLLGRSCSYCGRARAFRYWSVVAALATASAYAWLHPPARLGFGLGLLLLGYFGVVFVIDMEHRLILHPTSIFGALLALGLGWLAHGLKATLLGGLGGLLIMLIFYGIGRLFTRLRARRMQDRGEAPDDEEALGQGDVTLAVILGLLLGWPLIWFCLVLGIFLAGIFGMLMFIRMLAGRRYRNLALMTFLPYGPFFILGAYLMVFLPGLVRAILPK